MILREKMSEKDHKENWKERNEDSEKKIKERIDKEDRKRYTIERERE